MLHAIVIWLLACAALGLALRGAEASVSAAAREQTLRQHAWASVKYAAVVAGVSLMIETVHVAMSTAMSRGGQSIPPLAERPLMAPKGLSPEGLTPEGLTPEGLTPEGLTQKLPEISELKRMMVRAVTERPAPPIVPPSTFTRRGAR